MTSEDSASGASAGDAATPCPSCGQPVRAGDTFCEACGAELTAGAADVIASTEGTATAPPASGVVRTGTSPASAPTLPPPAVDPSSPTSISVAPGALATACSVCGGTIADDGFCNTCGAKARVWRDHWTEEPAPWVGAVCDRGIRHSENQDAIATAASTAAPPDPDALAVLVVCDGVTSAPFSERASLAAATEARDHLEASVAASPHHDGAAGVEAGARWMTAAARIAQVAVLGVTERLAAESASGAVDEPPSCTFVAAVITGRRVVVGWCGDSRAYWLGDDGLGRQLGVDHSLASDLIAGGMSRADAEHDPTAHTITRWLGVDSPTPTPDVVTMDAPGPGWVLVCSDGLWNEASEPSELAALIARAQRDGAATPLAIAESLAAFANERGGPDNISVALARLDVARLDVVRIDAGHDGEAQAAARTPDLTTSSVTVPTSPPATAGGATKEA